MDGNDLLYPTVHLESALRHLHAAIEWNMTGNIMPSCRIACLHIRDLYPDLLPPKDYRKYVTAEQNMTPRLVRR